MSAVRVETATGTFRVPSLCVQARRKTIPLRQRFACLTRSSRKMSRVQIGPKNSEANHHPKPLLPLVWASPALINESVNHPTAYSPVFCNHYEFSDLYRQTDTPGFNVERCT